MIVQTSFLKESCLEFHRQSVWAAVLVEEGNVIAPLGELCPRKKQKGTAAPFDWLTRAMRVLDRHTRE